MQILIALMNFGLGRVTMSIIMSIFNAHPIFYGLGYPIWGSVMVSKTLFETIEGDLIVNILTLDSCPDMIPCGYKSEKGILCFFDLVF